jgi:hypothetical protein
MMRQDNRYVFRYVDCYTGRRDKTTDRYSFMLTAIQEDETRQQIGIPLCWLCYTGRRDKTTDRYSFMLTLLYRDDETRQQIHMQVFLYVDSAIQADETRQQICIPLCWLLYRDDETRQHRYSFICWLCYTGRRDKTTDRYSFMLTAIQKWQDKTTDRYSFMLTLLYRDDETRQQIGIPLCWLCYTEMTRQDNR